MKNTLQDKTNKEIVQYLFDKNWYDELWVDWDIINHINWEKKQSYHDFCVEMGEDLLDYILYEQSINDFDYDKSIDLMYERANNSVDIYYADLYRSVPAFSDYINDVINDWLIDMKNFELWKAIQAWQWKFYETFWYELIAQIKMEIEEEKNI